MDLKVQQAQALMQTQARTEVNQNDDTFKFTLISNIEESALQERLTMQIVRELQKALGTDDVACIIDAKHLCVNSRGIRDVASSTVTAEYGGMFEKDEVRREFLRMIELDTQYQ